MKTKNEKYLLIGGNGFIGRNIQKSFKNSDINYLSIGSTDVTGSLRSCLRSAILEFRPTRAVFLSAKVGSMSTIRNSPFSFIRDNSMIFLDAFSAFEDCFNHGYKFKILSIISNCVYPASIDYQREKDIFNGPPHSSVEAFAQAKRLLISLGENFSRSHNAEVLNLVLANSFGPFDHLDSNRSHALTGLVVRMIEAKRISSKCFDVWGTGSPIRSWLYAPDFADEVHNIFENEAVWKQGTLNFPPSVPNISIKDLAFQIAQIIGYEGEIIFDTSKPDGDPVKILMPTNFENIYKPKTSDFSEALEKTIDYFKDAL